MENCLLKEVSAFISQKNIGMFIGGQWRDSVEGSTFQTLDPGSGKVLASVAEGKAEDVDLAVKAAKKAFKESNWASMSARERGQYLHRLADLVEENRQILVQLESLDVGKPLAQADGFDIPNVAQTLRWYADLAVATELKKPIEVQDCRAYQLYTPLGVSAFVLPWNFPLLLVGWNLAPSLAAGNTAVIKPAEDTPLTTLYFCKLVEQAGIPPGVVNVVPGYGHTAGVALACHPQINHMGFTGSPEVGREIASACGKNLVPVKLELGGKGAAVVFDDVDVDNTVEQLVGAVTLNTGQVCCTATRWLVHQNIWEEFVVAAVKKMSSIKIGYGQDSSTQMGPAINQKQKNRILKYIENGINQKAEALLDGGIAEVKDYPNGFYVKPCLLVGNPDNICAKEEIFGPVAYLIKFGSEQQAIEIVNGIDYGLANSVWTKDDERAAKVAESMIAGNSWINAHNLFYHGVPYAGCNLSGFGGGVLGPDTLSDYLRPQSIVTPL
jgi:aldehyde dehydrogenase (NAD+)